MSTNEIGGARVPPDRAFSARPSPGATAVDEPPEPGSRHDSPQGKPRLRGWIHVGALVVILIVGPLLIASSPTASAAAYISVYVASLVALFGVSAAFHRRNWSPGARRRMRRADHATIFVAIAGTYTAVAGLALGGTTRVVLLTVVWCGAVAGIVFRQVWLDAPKWAIAIPYVVVGLAALGVVPSLVHSLGGEGFTLLMLGGIAYTLGAVAYSARRPNPVPGVFGYHEVFHTCTVVGAALEFACIAFFALPRH